MLEKNTVIAQKTHKNSLIYFALFGMILLFLISMVTIVLFDVFDNISLFANVVVALLGQLFTIVLLLCYSLADFSSEKHDRMYFILICITFIDFFLSTAVPCMSGNDELTPYILAGYTLYYLMSPLFSVVFWIFSTECLPYKSYYPIASMGIVLYSTAYAVLIVYNMSSGIFFSVIDGYIVMNGNDIISTAIYLVFLVFYLIIILSSDAKLKDKLAMLSYIMFPAINILSLVTMTIHGIIFPIDLSVVISLLLPLYLIFFNIYVQQKKEFYRQEAEISEMNTSIMLSQIQPHFLFNSLATISSLCEIENAEKSKEAVDRFAKYLRGNIDSLKNEKYIEFAKELEHTKTYLWLEKMRFGDMLEIEYDIQCTDFKVPSLGVQPLVENAVKHGICKSENGGKVTISTQKKDSAVYIKIIDNGVGFDTSKKASVDGRSHIGIENIRSRIAVMCGGKLEIESKTGFGTTATITIPMDINNSR